MCECNAVYVTLDVNICLRHQCQLKDLFLRLNLNATLCSLWSPSLAVEEKTANE